MGNCSRGSNTVARELQRIPGVGKSIAQDLIHLQIFKIKDLKDQNAEFLYERLCRLKGGPIDRCVLYVFRCAVYYASEDTHDPELLKWWNWKDELYAPEKDA